MDRTDPIAQDLADVAAVHAARTEVARAIGPLEASPFDDRAAAAMRDALTRVESPAVQAALGRLHIDTARASAPAPVRTAPRPTTRSAPLASAGPRPAIHLNAPAITRPALTLVQSDDRGAPDLTADDPTFLSLPAAGAGA